MKKSKETKSSRRTLAIVAALVALAAIVGGIVAAFGALRALWLEQCAVTDVNAQVEIITGDHIKADAIRELFGLRNGTNLALVDFAARRKEAMRQTPRIKAIGIARKLPDGVTITVTERDPFAKLNLHGSQRESGLVCDDEGVVFSCKRGAEMLPAIREPAPGTKTGNRLEKRALAALAVLRAVRDPEFLHLGVIEIDTSKPDFLQLTLASYKTVKFAWTGMDDLTPESNAHLLRQLRCVSQVIATNLQPDTRVWNATQPGFVTADLYGNH